MKKSAGVTLSQAGGPLQKLIQNLSGKHGEYWLTALTKMLRKEELPKPPPEVKKILDSENTRTRIKTELERLVEYLKAFSVVEDAHVCDVDEGVGDLIDISVFPCFIEFFHKEIPGDGILYTLRTDGTVGIADEASKITQDTIVIDCCKEKYESLKDFCDTLLILEKKFEESIPKIPA